MSVTNDDCSAPRSTDTTLSTRGANQCFSDRWGGRPASRRYTRQAFTGGITFEERTLSLPSHPLRAALLGTGAVARFHASALETLESVELVAAASMSDAESFVRSFRSRVVTVRSISYSGPRGRMSFTFALRQKDTHPKRGRGSRQMEWLIVVPPPSAANRPRHGTL
jgi:hypothetical protein